MPLRNIDGPHIRVVCDACHTASAEICGKRELPVHVKETAIKKFIAAGWHNDASFAAPTLSRRGERDGRWYCPACARRTHL